jgi:hypothetical protein
MSRTPNVLEIAGNDPAARVWGVEVREIVDTSGSGM